MFKQKLRDEVLRAYKIYMNLARSFIRTKTQYQLLPQNERFAYIELNLQKVYKHRFIKKEAKNVHLYWLCLLAEGCRSPVVKSHTHTERLGNISLLAALL
jgi:hypothetical protein